MSAARLAPWLVMVASCAAAVANAQGSSPSPAVDTEAADAAASGDAPTPTPEVALPAHLTLDDALARFRQHGFDLLLADAAVAGAQGDLVAARAFPNPLVSGSGGHTFTYRASQCGASGCSATQWNASVSDQGLLFDLLIGKRRLRRDVAEAALEAARANRVDAERTLTSLLKQGYAQAVLAGQLLDFAREVSETSARTLHLVEVRLHAGDASEADLARAEASKLETEQAVNAAEQELATAKAELAFLLGVRGHDAHFEVDADLPAATEPAGLQGATADTLIALATSHRPDLAAARAQVTSAEAAVALAKRQRLPDVSVVAAYQEEGHGQDAIQPPTASVGVSLPLPLFYRNAGEILRAEAGLRSERLQRDKLVAQIASDVSSTLSAYRSSAQRVQRMETQLLSQAKRARDLVDYQYQKGATSLFELLDAQRSYVATHAEYLQDLGDYWTARYRLEEAIAMELRP